MIDRLQFFVRPGSTNNDLFSLQFLQIKSMQWLTAFHQHIIGNVDQIINRRDTDCFQPIDQPGGTGTNLDSSNHPRMILRTEIGTLDRDRSHRTGFRGSRLHRRRRNLERFLVQDCGLASNSQMAKTIRAITGHFEIDAPVIVDRVKLFQIQARHRQSIGKFRDGHIQIDVLLKPVPADEHIFSPFSESRTLTKSAVLSRTGLPPRRQLPVTQTKA